MKIIVPENNDLAIFLLGATGVGKSDVALALAEKHNLEIVNCDSQQVYQELDAGTAKPSSDQMSAVPHHLYSFVSAGDQYTAGEYRRDVLAFLDENRKKGKTRFLFVGGSGFYVQSVLTQMYSIGKVDNDVRKIVEQEIAQSGYEPLFEELKKRDATYAQKIGPKDHYRLQRAIETLRSTGYSPAELLKEKTLKANPLEERAYKVMKLALDIDRQLLRERIKVRAEKMLAHGLIEETERLMKKGLAHWRPLNSVGYKEVREYLNGKLPREDLLEKITISTFQLAKRQKTWFKRDSEIQWLEPNFQY